jgi:hypothetical protein
MVNAPVSENVLVKDKNSKIITSVQEQLERWKEHFSEVLNLEHPPNMNVETAQTCPELQISIRPPSKREIIETIKAMKKGKAAGIDDIPSEILQAVPHFRAEMLYPLFLDIWKEGRKEGRFSKDWKEGIIVKIPKKGDYRNCNKWRGITLLVVISKVFTRIILDRISGILETGIRKEQASFRPNRSCIDQISTLRIIIEQSLEFQSPLYLLFVDYQKAFDSMDKRWIWKALEERGLPNKFIKLIQEGYNQFSCRVLHNGQLTVPFETKCEVRQGCLLSPLLFLVALDKVLRASLDGKSRGIRWKLTEILEDLVYADDIWLAFP